MSILAAACCCTVPSVCPKWYATSYLASGISGNVSFSKQYNLSYSCWCPVGEPNTIPTSYSINVSYSQVTPIVMVLNDSLGPSGCCYRGQGQIEIQYSVTLTHAVHWCDWSDANLCPWGEGDPPDDWTAVQYEEVTLTGSATVDCCLDVIPFGTFANEGWPAGATGATPTFLHTLNICDFPVGGSITPIYDSFGGSYGPCYAVGGIPFSLRCVGAQFAWISPRQELDTLAGEPKGFLSVCQTSSNESLRRCGPGLQSGVCASDQLSCYPCVALNQLNHGPFAMVGVEEFGGQDIPEPCTLGTTGTLATFKTVPTAGGGGQTCGLDPSLDCNPNGSLDEATLCCSILRTISKMGWIYT